MELQRVRHNEATKYTHTHTYTHTHNSITLLYLKLTQHSKPTLLQYKIKIKFRKNNTLNLLQEWFFRIRLRES